MDSGKDDFQKENEKLSFHERYPLTSSLGAGAVAGAVAKTLIAPLDRAKISFQIRSDRYSLKKALRFVHATYTNDGLRACWRGNTATLARVIPYAAFNYTAHEQWKILLKVDSNSRKKPVLNFLSGSLAGVTATSLTYPLDMARARMAISRCETYKNLGEVFMKIWSHEGPAALFHGIVPTLLGAFFYAGVSFYTFGCLKRHLATLNEDGSTEISPTERIVSGAAAGLLGQSCSYPLDIVRRRMQTSAITGGNYTTVRGTLYHVFKNEGVVHGLYKGLSMNWIKGPIASGTSFLIYDTVMSSLKKR